MSMVEADSTLPNPAVLRLGRALARLDPEAGWKELRDTLWLAKHLPKGIPVLKTPIAVEGEALVLSDSREKSPPAVISTSLDSEKPVFHKRVVVDVDDDGEGPSAVYSGLSAPPPSGGAGGLSGIRLPSPHPLPEAASLARALRPLGRRRRGGTSRPLLDEERTAERIAETGLPQPVLKAERKRWFDAVVAVDSGLTLLAWRPRVDEFVALLRRRAGLRDVHLFSLHGQNGNAVMRTPDGRIVNPAAWNHGQGGRLLLVVSDASGPGWHDGTMARWLDPWSRQMPVAMAQLLPLSLWSHTGLGFASLRVQAQRPGAPNAALQVQRPGWAEGEPGLVLPVFPLDEIGARQWSRMLMASGGARCIAALLPFDSSEFLLSDSTLESTDPMAPSMKDAALLSALKRAARPHALKLAAALAAIKPLTLPVVRLVHATQASQGSRVPDVEDLAQVLASGLLQPRAPLAPEMAFRSNADHQVLLDMADSVRDELVGALTGTEWFDLNLAVQRYFQEVTGSTFDFLAYIEDREGSSQLAPNVLPFARFARKLADRFRPPGSKARGGSQRAVDEIVAGPGLTVQTELDLPAGVRSLKWSADGRRLGVLHGLGLDLFDGAKLHQGPRTRTGGWKLLVLCHVSDVDAVKELMVGVARRLETEMQRPVSVLMEPMKSLEPSAWASRVMESLFRPVDVQAVRQDIVRVFALTESLAPTISPEAWARLAIVSDNSPRLALTNRWAGVDPRADRWLGSLAHGAASPELAAGIDDLRHVLESTEFRSSPEELEAFDFSNTSGMKWMAFHHGQEERSLMVHGVSLEGSDVIMNTSSEGWGPASAVKMPSVQQLLVLDGEVLALCEGELTSWQSSSSRGEPSTHQCLAVAVTPEEVVELLPDGTLDVRPRAVARK